jgi:hypothetical protein
MRFRIRFRIQLINFDVGPNADPDPYFYLMRIQVTKMMQILIRMRIPPDLDPQHWLILCTVYRAYSAERVKLGRFLLNREGGKAPFLAHLKAALVDPCVPLEQFRNERISLPGSSHMFNHN